MTAAHRRSVAVSQIAVRGPSLDMLKEPDVAPRRSRIRPFDGTAEESDRLVAMATMIRAPDGAPLRLRSAVLAHEHGTYATPKAQHPLVWEGEAQQEALIEADVDFDTVEVSTESVEFEMVVNGATTNYTVDVAVRTAEGRERFVEIKRDERDLEDPDYRLKLARVAEICRRCEIDFRVVLRSEIFRSDRHRRNAALVASRGFATIGPEHLRRLDRHRRDTRGESTLGDLAKALEPASIVRGEALVHALVVRRRVRMDVAQRLLPSAPLVIA